MSLAELEKRVEKTEASDTMLFNLFNGDPTDPNDGGVCGELREIKAVLKAQNKPDNNIKQMVINQVITLAVGGTAALIVLGVIEFLQRNA